MLLRRCMQLSSLLARCSTKRPPCGTTAEQAARRACLASELTPSCPPAFRAGRALRCAASQADDAGKAATAAIYGEAGLEEYRHQEAPNDECRTARKYLFGLLSARPYPVSQLRPKLQRRHFTPETIEWALASVQEIGLQSDLEYAAAYARTKLLRSKWALRKIRSELQTKGVSGSVVTQALQRLEKEELENLAQEDGAAQEGGADSDSDCEDRDGMHRLLMSASRKQVDNMERAGVPLPKRQRRLIAWLQRRGHSWATAMRVLDELGMSIGDDFQRV